MSFSHLYSIFSHSQKVMLWSMLDPQRETKHVSINSIRILIIWYSVTRPGLHIRVFNYVSPLEGSGDILFFPLRLSVTKSCLLYNLITVRDISTKLHTFVKHIQMTCYAQEP